MKNYVYLVFLALLSCHTILAEVVPEDKARTIASDFFASVDVTTKSTARPSDFKLVCTFPKTSTKASSHNPTMYVFERATGGYAVVSGDDVARPVLGYSLDGSFPNGFMPDNMKWLLLWYSDIIEYARSQNWGPNKVVSTRADLDPANSMVLQTVKWNQLTPFNNLVKEINGEKPPIGCVATAISIIMRYHMWPVRGKGTLPSYDYVFNNVKEHVDGFSLGHEYLWDKMPGDYQNCNGEEADQIARLLYDVAVMCEMRFAPGGSDASIWAASNLIEYFGYDNGMKLLFRNDYPVSSQEWESILIEEINAKRPILYGGDRKEEDYGHAFVIDGYKGDYFSINYGWGGGSSYYTITPVVGHDENLTTYYKNQGAVIRILPDQSIGVKPGFYVPQRAITWFTMCPQSIINTIITSENNYDSFSEFRFELHSKNGTLKEVLSPTHRVNSIFSLSSWGLFSNLEFTKSLSNGDYITVSINNPESGKWEELPSARSGRVVFTTRPLSELVEIGYSRDDNAGNADVTDIYVKFYKDICWDIFKENSDESMLGYYGYLTKSSIGGIYTMDWGAMSVDLVNPDNLDCDTAIIKMSLPSGTYNLRLTNPATGEEMTITLEV